MEESKFARLVRVSLDDMWNGDGREFLTWLARPDNLSYLGELLERSLEPDSLADGSDPRDAILVCRDRKTGARVLVVSPVVRSGDSELGKSMVYASRFTPSHLVLMAGNFLPQHIQALNWFNAVTSSATNIFGLEVEFWRIGNSPLAPNFNLLISPADLVQTPAPVETPETAHNMDLDEGTGTLSRFEAIFPTPEPPPPDLPTAESTQPVPEHRYTEPVAEAPADETPGERPMTPSGMRRMFSSRGFSKAITGNLPPEESQGASQTPPEGHDVSTKATSPIGNTRAEGTSRDESAQVNNAGWDSVPAASPAANGGAEWPSAEATVTPSGMLQRLRVREGDPAEEAANDSISNGGSDTSELYLEFWEQFLADVIQFDGTPPSRRAMLQGWISMPLDRKYFSLVAFMNKSHNMAGLGLVIDGPESKSFFSQLVQDKEQIESELGESLDWRELPDKEESHIYLHRRNVDISNRANWSDYHNWYADVLEAFLSTFGNRINSLGRSIDWGS